MRTRLLQLADDLATATLANLPTIAAACGVSDQTQHLLAVVLVVVRLIIAELAAVSPHDSASSHRREQQRRQRRGRCYRGRDMH